MARDIKLSENVYFMSDTEIMCVKGKANKAGRDLRYVRVDVW